MKTSNIMWTQEDCDRLREKLEDEEITRGKFPPDYFIEKQAETTSHERELIYAFYSYLIFNHCIDTVGAWHLEREEARKCQTTEKP